MKRFLLGLMWGIGLATAADYLLDRIQSAAESAQPKRRYPLEES